MLRSHLISRPTRLIAAAALLAGAGCGDSGGVAGPPVPGGALRYTHLSAGYYHTCGLATGGTAYCWGGNSFGTLGDGTLTGRSVPTPVADGRSFASLDAGAGHNCALTAAGEAWCWGQNDEGQLGDGTFTIRNRPVPVAGGMTFASISAGHAHSCGLTTNGETWCWGDDSHGQLGDGGAAVPGKSAVPVRVPFDEPFNSIHAGYYQTCAVTSQAAAYCWGLNSEGQNGDGSKSDRLVPVAVEGDLAFTSLSPGDRFVCGVSSNSVWCWGANLRGELGSAGPDTSTVPVALPGTSSIHAVVTSQGPSTVPSAEPYGCGLAMGGSVSCWGGAIRGLMPRGDIRPLDDRIRASVIAPGSQHVCLLGRDGYAYCGGANYSGQLGDGTHTDRGPIVAVAGPAA